MLLAQGAIAFLIARRFETMLVIATLTAVTASVIGIYVSFFFDSAPAPTIVLLLASGFTIAFVATRQPPARHSASHPTA